MSAWVDITFDCMPLRSIGRLDIPLDASPKYRAFCERINNAIETHGSHNTYYLYNARCVYHLTNRPDHGMLEFRFDGTVFTDATDLKTDRCELQVDLVRIPAPDIDVASAILSHAADTDASLIVMGGYGHSKLRELALGGATRGIVESMTLPTLMSH